MFIDETIINVLAGKGGDGCLAFRREKFVPMGGPFGGNGGKGGDIIFKVDEGLRTLIDLRYMKTIKADKGENGRGKNQDGAKASNVVIKVPQGTVVSDLATGQILADLNEKDMEVVIAYGGRGGRGNTAFKTHSNPAPNYAENGEPGEEKELKVELKLMADVGLVGMPSVGKSSIISMISKAKPKIAAYHFTTLTPNLGVCKSRSGYSYVVADLPGLIEGASQGDGLGDRFLRHIERTRVIAHVIDMASTEGRDPVSDYDIIRKELGSYNPSLLERPEIIIANKMDIEGSKENLEKFKKTVKKEIFAVSAATGEGLQEVVDHLADLLKDIPVTELYEKDEQLSHVLYKFKEEKPFTIEKDGDVFVIKGERVEKLYKMTKFNTEEALERFSRSLRKMGIDDELVKMGAQEGDLVRIDKYTFEFE